MRVLVLGGGGREHALCVALARDPGVEAVHASPGNPGMAAVATCHPAGDPVDLARALAVDLVVVGPEAPLVEGVADDLRAAGIAVFGPGRAAGQLEGSKAFAKDVMATAGVPTAGHTVCRTLGEVAAALDSYGPPYVVKHDELAGGKGVVVTDDRDAALAHAAGHTVVVEEFLDGPEVSLFCLVDTAGTIVPLLPAQDFKRAGDGDTGPNTGGMGAYTPLPWAEPGLAGEVVETVARPTVAQLARQGAPFTGLLYCGLALTGRGLRVVEFNVRFGDPETQPLLALLETPLGGLLHAVATGRLADHPPLRWRNGSAVAVVVAAEGYPSAPVTGDAIDGIEAAEELAAVFHAGTATGADGRTVTSGGRVLAVTATGGDLAEARVAAYDALSRIRIRGAHHRSDIAEVASRHRQDGTPPMSQAAL